MKIKSDNISDIYKTTDDQSLKMPVFYDKVPAGFPSPADNYLEGELDIRDLIDHPAATFFVRVVGDSMIDAGIFSGDLLLVNRAVEAKSGDIVVALAEGSFTVKTYDKISETEGRLLPANPNYKPIVFN